MKKNRFNWIYLIIGILLFVGFILMAIRKFDYVILGKATNLNNLLVGNVNDHMGEYVSLNVDAVIDNYAETKHTINFIPVGKDQHYLVWLDDDTIISVAVPNKKAKDMERLIEETWDAINNNSTIGSKEPLKVIGLLNDIDYELKKYYDEAIDYYGINDNPTLKVSYLHLNGTESRLMVGLYTLLILGISLFMFFVYFAGRKTNNPTLDEEFKEPSSLDNYEINKDSINENRSDKEDNQI